MVLEKLHTLVEEATRQSKQKEKEIRASGFKNLAEIDELAEINARKVYYECIVRKLNKLGAK